MLMNSWGFAGWGVSETQLEQLVTTLPKDAPAFIVSTKNPFSRFVSTLAKKGIFTEKFELGENLWVYKLVNSSAVRERKGTGSFKPAGISVGLGMNTENPSVKRVFGPEEKIMVKLAFEKTVEPVLVNFNWTDPNGGVYLSSDPFVIEEGNTSVWSHLEDKGPLPAGKWSVDAFVNNKRVMGTTFVVKP